MAGQSRCSMQGTLLDPTMESATESTSCKKRRSHPTEAVQTAGRLKTTGADVNPPVHLDTATLKSPSTHIDPSEEDRSANKSARSDPDFTKTSSKEQCDRPHSRIPLAEDVQRGNVPQASQHNQDFSEEGIDIKLNSTSMPRPQTRESTDAPVSITPPDPLSSNNGVFGSNFSGGGFGSFGGSSAKLKSFAKGADGMQSLSGAIEHKASDRLPLDAMAESGESKGTDPTQKMVVNPSTFKEVMDEAEAAEDVRFQARGALYSFEGTWKERGKGQFKFNVQPGEEKSKAHSARFIMRADRTYRILLNSPLMAGMKFGDSHGQRPTDRNFAFPVIEDSKSVPHMIKFADALDSQALYQAASDFAKAAAMSKQASLK